MNSSPWQKEKRWGKIFVFKGSNQNVKWMQYTLINRPLIKIDFHFLLYDENYLKDVPLGSLVKTQIKNEL